MFRHAEEFKTSGSSIVHKKIEGKAAARRILALAFAFIFALSIAACAGKAARPKYKRLPSPAQKAPEGPPKPVEKEVSPPPRTNARPSTEDAMTPRRQASMRLVDKGNVFVASMDYERAAALFRDAINVDGSNGVAYYYMAVADAKLGAVDVAAGLLDKAEAMLGADSEWMTKIDELRTELGLSPAAHPTAPSPIDEAF